MRWSDEVNPLVGVLRRTWRVVMKPVIVLGRTTRTHSPELLENTGEITVRRHRIRGGYVGVRYEHGDEEESSDGQGNPDGLWPFRVGEQSV